MAQNNDATDATLTEYLPAAQNGDDSIDGPARISYIKVGFSWQTDDGEKLEADPEYRVECSCGEEFGNWGAATKHADEEH